jgi:hypothetical protein
VRMAAATMAVLVGEYHKSDAGLHIGFDQVAEVVIDEVECQLRSAGDAEDQGVTSGPMEKKRAR